MMKVLAKLHKEGINQIKIYSHVAPIIINLESCRAEKTKAAQSP